MIKVFSLLLIFLSTPTLAGVISSAYFEDGKKVNTFKYFYEGDIFKRCDENNDCDFLYNKNKRYCKNIFKIKDDLDIETRMRWECPRYESMKNIKKYNIKLSNDPAFTDYTFNLDKILLYEYKLLKNKIVFEDLNISVGMTPRNIFIPYDINDLIAKIIIKLDLNNYVLSEKYEMKDRSIFVRQYIYTQGDIRRIIEIKKDGNNKILNKNEYFYEYK